MNYEKLTGNTIEKAFKKYHKNNPVIYLYYKKYALSWIITGAKKISSKQIIGRIRWEIEVEVHSVDNFKINDAFTAHYARLFTKEYPQYSNIFEFRKLRS